MMKTATYAPTPHRLSYHFPFQDIKIDIVQILKQLHSERHQIDVVNNEFKQLVSRHQRCRQSLFEAQTKAEQVRQTVASRHSHQQSHTDESTQSHNALSTKIATQRNTVTAKRNQLNYAKSIEMTAANKRRQDIRAKLSTISQEVIHLRQQSADNHSKSLLAKDKTMANLRRKLHKAKKELHERRFDVQSKECKLQSEVEAHRQRRDVLKRKLENALSHQENMDEPLLKKQEDFQKAITALQVEQSEKRQKHSTIVQDMDLALSSALARRTQAQLLVSKLSEKESTSAKKLDALCSKQEKIERMRKHILALEAEAEDFHVRSQQKVQSTQAQLEELRQGSDTTGQVAEMLAEQNQAEIELADQETTIAHLEQLQKKLGDKMDQAQKIYDELKTHLDETQEKVQSEQQMATANEVKTDKILIWKRKFDNDDIKPTIYLQELKRRLSEMEEELDKEGRLNQPVDVDLCSSRKVTG